MKLADIGATNKEVLRVLHPRKISDHVADVYGKVRDATICNDNIAPADCIAILELVKAELLRDVQSQIDEGAE
jgi:hypothetical protein